MDRYWLLTWTCYGQWLSGDSRGFVAHVRDADGDRVRHNTPGTPCDANLPRLEGWMRRRMSGDPVVLNRTHADALIAQYRETVRIRAWSLEAASVMFNHTHLVVGVEGDPDPGHVRELFKGWATRAVRKLRPLPPNGTFWTAKGSERKLPDEAAVRAAVVYVVRKQPNPLAVWSDPRWGEALDEHDRASRAELGEPSRVSDRFTEATGG